MTGPEHYREAEKLLRLAGETQSSQLAADCQQAAQVHATLAVADQVARLVEPDPELSPEITAMVNDWLAQPACTACGGIGKAPDDRTDT